MNYSTMSRPELTQLCKTRKIRGYSGKKRGDMIALLQGIIEEKVVESEEKEKETIVEKAIKSEEKAIKSVEKAIEDKNTFVFQTMLTCIGNKRKLVHHIRNIVDDVRTTLSKEKLNIVDGFAGSSVVSRELSYVADRLYTNDLELYSYLMAHCYLVVPTAEQRSQITTHIVAMNCIAERGPYIEGTICAMYAPKVTKSIQEGERCFYTRENALVLDTLRQYIADHVDPLLVPYCLVPLLNKASIHTNTAGVFKGFYKKGSVGCFGGNAECALSRIMKPIRLDIPVWNLESDYTSIPSNMEILERVNTLPDDIDIMYLDPPYNQHPYGSNYFMLNVLAKHEMPQAVSKVSGIPTDWNKSDFNTHTKAIESMKQLLQVGLQRSAYLLISYNHEGIIETDEWTTLLLPYRVKKYEIPYDTYKGSRNLKERTSAGLGINGQGDKVMEVMYLISNR